MPPGRRLPYKVRLTFLYGFSFVPGAFFIMGELVKLDTGEIVSYDDAKLQYQRIETVKQAIIIAQKLGIDIGDITPPAINILWCEVALGRFLRSMEKNKGTQGQLSGKNISGSLVIRQPEDDTPTVEEIVGSRDKSSLLQKIGKFTDDTIQDYIDLCIENKFLPKSADLKNKNTTISKMTGDNEGYTPSEYIEMARRVMGSIDLDPASSDFAQEIVKADRYFTEEDDGLSQDWIGNIWLNPPYENKLITQFIDKLIGEKNIDQAIVLTNNNTDTQWFKKLYEWSDLICFTTGRINFYKKDGTISAPTNGQTFFYIGKNYKIFAEEFRHIGLIMIKYE